MKTKISRLKKDISLLREKLQQCRNTIHEKQLKNAEQTSFVQNPSSILSYTATPIVLTGLAIEA